MRFSAKRFALAALSVYFNYTEIVKTSRNGRECGLEIRWGQRKTGKGGKDIVATSSVAL